MVIVGLWIGNVIYQLDIVSAAVFHGNLFEAFGVVEIF